MPSINKFFRNNIAFFPLDFYRFRHTEEVAISHDKKSSVIKPLWVVGVSPFDNEISEDEGHVVHLSTPSFTARWSMNEERIESIMSPAYYDEDLNMIIYDVVPMTEKDIPTEEWLLESVCAVGYAKGLIASAPIEGVH